MIFVLDIVITLIVTYLYIVKSGAVIGDIDSKTLFRTEQIIFSSKYNITNILVDGKYIRNNDIPSLFFTVADPRSIGGSCIYVLEGLRVSALRVLEGGRDSTVDYVTGMDVYFGAYNGLYKYVPETLSAKRYGVFDDDIIQLQKAKASDTFYILTSNNKVYVLEKGGTVKTKVPSISCAKQLVLDTSDNIYYVNCKDNSPRTVLANGTPKSLTCEESFKAIKLLRPAFMMEECIPFFGDGTLHFLYANGSCINKEFRIQENPSAFSIDATLYIVAALNGKIYEFNVMEVMLKSMFGILNGRPKDLSKIIVSMITAPKPAAKQTNPFLVYF